MSRLWRILSGMLAAALLGLVLTAGAASAIPDTGDDPAQYTTQGALTLLPVNRWSDATSTMHSRLGTFDLTEKIQRNGTYPVLMSLGNSMWSGATGLTSAAIRMDILDVAGEAADGAVATLGKSMISSGILALMAVVAIVSPLWKAARGQGAAPWGAFAKAMGTIALFAVMINGAAASGTDGAGHFKPGTFSPGWFVVTTNNVLSSIASAPAAALTIKDDSGAGFNYADTPTGDLSCAQYVTYMKDQYTGVRPIDQMENSIPVVMSGMWEATGLQVWADSQFGAKNDYGSFSYCRLLEQNAQIEPRIQQSFTTKAATSALPAGSSVDSLAWETAENDQTDRTMVAWGECRPNGAGWTVETGWDAEDIDDCNDWWTKAASFNDGDTFKDKTSAFDYANESDVVSDADSPEAKNYLLTLQGHGGSAGLALVFTYVASALIMFVIFGLISGAILVAKVSALVMIIATVFVLLMSLWPSASKGSVGKFFMQYVGMSLFVCGIQFVFAFLTLITSILIKAGNDMFGPGTIISMIWTGFAPVVAAFVIHTVFKKFLKVPSPFSMSGAQQWGAAASGGAVGGAVGSSLSNGLSSQMRRARYRTQSKLRREGERMSGRVLGTVSGGRFGRGGGGGRSGQITTDGAAQAAPSVASTRNGVSSAVAARDGARVLSKVTGGTGPVSTAPVSTVEAAPMTRAERIKAALDEKTAANAAARDRGAKNTILGRRLEGATARIQNAKDAFADRPVGFRGQAAAAGQLAGSGAKRTAKAAAAAAGVGALVVGSGGLAIPALAAGAAVWGTKAARRQTRAGGMARDGAIAEPSARQQVDQLAAKKRMDRDERAEGGHHQSIAERKATLAPQSGRRTAGRAAAAALTATLDESVAVASRSRHAAAQDRPVDTPRSNGEVVSATSWSSVTEQTFVADSDVMPAQRAPGSRPAPAGNARVSGTGRRAARPTGPRGGKTW